MVSTEILDKELKALHKIFVYTKDRENYQVRDDWRVPKPDPETGLVHDDCDGFALYLWDRLRTVHGIKSRLIICEVISSRTGKYIGHAVIHCEGYLLDNISEDIFSKSERPSWKWHSISDYNITPGGWRDLTWDNKPIQQPND